MNLTTSNTILRNTPKVFIAGSTVASLVLAVEALHRQTDNEYHSHHSQPHLLPGRPYAVTATALCEAAPHLPSWRHALHTWRVYPLSPPPRPLYARDPLLTLPRWIRTRRQQDDQRQADVLREISALVQQVPSSSSLSEPVTNELLRQRQQEIAALQTKWIEIVYGSGVTLQDRQDFLERYGCTGWTDEVMDFLVKKLGKDVGFVEIGAGNGQWARALTDGHRRHYESLSEASTSKRISQFCLAYDNGSKLPLNPEIYTSKTKASHKYFGKVKVISGGGKNGNGCVDIVTQWRCRGRVLLLVYPPPSSDMAVEALKAYDLANETDKATLVYVGEGRGGATANEAFFDYLEDSENGWIVAKIMDVKSFGTKGHEKLYVFQKK